MLLRYHKIAHRIIGRDVYFMCENAVVKDIRFNIVDKEIRFNLDDTEYLLYPYTKEVRNYFRMKQEALK